MDALQAKVAEAKLKMAELNGKLSATQNTEEINNYNTQIQALVADLANFLKTNVAAQQQCI